MKSALVTSAAFALAVVCAGPAAAQSGSYQGSCRNVGNAAGRLTAECRTGSGAWRRTSIDGRQCQGDIGNHDGVLACNGAQGRDDGLVPEQSNRRADEDRGGGDRGGRDRGGDRDRGGYDRGGDDRGRDRGGYDRDRFGGGGGYGRGTPDLVLFDGFNYTGRAFPVYGSIDNLKDEGFNDRARSVRVNRGDWKLCRSADHSGCEHVIRDVPDLRAINAADQISSVERK